MRRILEAYNFPYHLHDNLKCHDIRIRWQMHSLGVAKSNTFVWTIHHYFFSSSSFRIIVKFELGAISELDPPLLERGNTQIIWAAQPNDD